MRLTKPVGAAIAGAFVGLLLAIVGAAAIFIAGSRQVDGERSVMLAGLTLLTSESTVGAEATQVSLALTATAMVLLVGLVVVGSVAGYLLSAARQRRGSHP